MSFRRPREISRREKLWRSYENDSGDNSIQIANYFRCGIAAHFLEPAVHTGVVQRTADCRLKENPL